MSTPDSRDVVGIVSPVGYPRCGSVCGTTGVNRSRCRVGTASGPIESVTGSVCHTVFMDDVWLIVHAERAALIGDLTGLTDDQWARPSLCGDWTVHDVAAHLINNAKTTRLGIVRDMARARFNFDRQNAQGVERERGATPRHTLSMLQQVATRTSTPPAPLDSRLVEEVVHGEDIRRPLGIKRVYLPEAVVRSLSLNSPMG